MLLLRHCQSGEDLQGGAADAALVRRGILEDMHARLLQHSTCAIGEEEVSAFADHPEFWPAVCVKERFDVAGGHGVRPPAARHEQVGTRVGCQMKVIPELRAGAPLGTIWEGHIGLLASHKEASPAHEGPAELLDGGSQERQPHQLFTLQAGGVEEHTRAIDDADRAVLGDQDLVRPEISVRATSLELCDTSLVLTELCQKFGDVSVDAGSGHAVDVVGHTTELHALSGGQCLPIRVAPDLADLGTQVHEIGRVLVRAEEEDLLATGHVAAEDSWLLLRQHAVEQRVQVLREARFLHGGALLGVLRAIAWVGEDDALRPTLRDVLVLHLLGEGQVVALVEQSRDVVLVRGIIAREHKAHAATRDVAKADVEAQEIPARHQVDAVGLVRIQRRRPALEHDGRVEAKGEGTGGLRLEKVRQQDALVESQEHFPDLAVLRIGAATLDGRLELGVELGSRLARCDAAEVLEDLDGEVHVAVDQIKDSIRGEQVLHAELVERFELALGSRVVLQDLVHIHVLPRILLPREEGEHELHCGRKVQADLMRDPRLHHAAVDHVRGLQDRRVHDRPTESLNLLLLGRWEEYAVDGDVVGKSFQVEAPRGEGHEPHCLANLCEVRPAALRAAELQDEASWIGPWVDAAMHNAHHSPAFGDDVLHHDLVLFLGGPRLLLQETR
mmetsp:Transcript_104046/g.333529  ORF Transcript_104046/g.333529 Transcript_104046/m.333529 type:complete len:672 (+) Transcript_104046:644-2659(+)